MGPKQSKRGDGDGIDPACRERMQKMLESSRRKRREKNKAQNAGVAGDIEYNPDVDHFAKTELDK